MIDRIVELRRVGQLKAHPNNVRTHPNKQIERLAESLKAFGFTNPILIDENNTVLAGHGRVAAARLAGLHKILCIVLRPERSAKACLSLGRQQAGRTSGL